MYIKNLTINNYKSFWQCQDIPFERGFNLIVGQNDAGKSALLEALQSGVDHKPHRSILTAPEPHSLPIPISKTSKEFVLNSDDIRAYLSGLDNFSVPVLSGQIDEARIYFQNVLSESSNLYATWSDRGISSAHMKGIEVGATAISFRNMDWPMGVNLGDHIGQGYIAFPQHIAQQLTQDIYGFNAERYRMGSCAAGGSRALLPSAANLPEVLNKLSEDPATERELLGHVRRIFPHITHVSAALENGNIAHVRVWTQPTSSRRRDLSIPLADSGSGIGQVLAMLYVVVTADRPKVILIDEPQSFLHPGAVRQLFEIFAGYSQHQYIVTTHAPAGLSIASASNMLLVKRGQDQSSVTRLDPATQKGVSVFLNEVGARLSDVFGADRVLWVEGKTEERCFPILVREVAKRPMSGTQILGVVNTGDLEAGFADRVVNIYQRLSGGASLLPPTVAFVFDREGRSEKERSDIERRSKGLVIWLPRRMFENYLLVPSVICILINSEDTREIPLNVEEIDTWLQKNGGNAEFFPKAPQLQYTDVAWVESVHAGKLLRTLFSELTSERVFYDKVEHGEQLTKLISLDPTVDITELATLIAALLPPT